MPGWPSPLELAGGTLEIPRRPLSHPSTAPLAGEVRLMFIEPPSDHHVTPAHPAIIPPQAAHRVVPLGPMTMQIEFYRERPIPAESTTDG